MQDAGAIQTNHESKKELFGSTLLELFLFDFLLRIRKDEHDEKEY